MGLTDVIKKALNYLGISVNKLPSQYVVEKKQKIEQEPSIKSDAPKAIPRKKRKFVKSTKPTAKHSNRRLKKPENTSDSSLPVEQKETPKSNETVSDINPVSHPEPSKDIGEVKEQVQILEPPEERIDDFPEIEMENQSIAEEQEKKAVSSVKQTFSFNPDGSIKLPENLRKIKETASMQEETNKFVDECFSKLDFDLKDCIDKMTYLGSFKSKRNWYYGYSYGDYFLISTGLREITRFNLLLKQEVDEIHEIIKTGFPTKYFLMSEILDLIIKSDVVSERISFYRDHHLEELHFNDFYNIVLQICYILVITNRLVLDKDGRNIILAINKKTTQSKAKPNIYANTVFVKDIGKSFIFKNDKFYLDIRFKNFRGSIALYLITEIEYMENIIKECPANDQLDVKDVMEKMEYYQRFHDIYQMMIDKNIRNDRDKFEFFISRVKSALRIIANITNLVEIEKEGRGNIYLRRN